MVFARLALEQGALTGDMEFLSALFGWLTESQAGWDRFFHDWRGGAASADRAAHSPQAALYAGPAFAPVRAGLEAITTRAMKMMAAGMEPGPEGSLNKLVSVRSRQKLSELAIDLMGNLGLGWDPYASSKDDWVASWLAAPTGRIAGGADEMLLNTIAEKILGLPQDHRPDKGVPFNEIPA